MENWIKFGGTVEFPRFIQFKVSTGGPRLVRFRLVWSPVQFSFKSVLNSMKFLDSSVFQNSHLSNKQKLEIVSLIFGQDTNKYGQNFLTLFKIYFLNLIKSSKRIQIKVVQLSKFFKWSNMISNGPNSVLNNVFERKILSKSGL